MLTLFALSDFFQGLLGPWVGHRLGPLRLGLINICRGVAEKFILQFQEEGYFRKSLKIDEPITLADFYFPSAFKRAEKKYTANSTHSLLFVQFSVKLVFSREIKIYDTFAHTYKVKIS